MPKTEEIEFHDETFGHITEEYEIPGDLNEVVFDQACSSIPAGSGRVEITYEDENTGGLRALLAITHISPDGERTELFRTAYRAAQIAPPPPEAPPLEQYEVYDVDVEMLAAAFWMTHARHRRTHQSHERARKPSSRKLIPPNWPGRHRPT